MSEAAREIKQLIEPQMVIEGAGVRLRRSFGPSRENLFDPFLLFDHFAFNDPIEGPIVGFPMQVAASCMRKCLSVVMMAKCVAFSFG
jgi:redox-sensitive bicupin YhaK (pirin superfamily)